MGFGYGYGYGGYGRKCKPVAGAYTGGNNDFILLVVLFVLLVIVGISYYGGEDCPPGTVAE
ncbi:YjcZ family sporulation protein [Radiobacillus deserti]|uniref:YjcZ family sporulation protein n=1 Tax=Radiobacillus deserti TaxID=2594883 RepID=A0A516KDT4_9BACI|nr:YjcZ family sporulation protein [Radiobacillus deserti]QDP39565.1 YjcZ family sporulation protein [Radiobacillus deserti]